MHSETFQPHYIAFVHVYIRYWLYQAYQNVCQSSGPPRNEQILELSLAWVTVLHSMAIDAVFVFTGPFALDRIDGLYEASVDAKVISSFQCAVIERGFEIHYVSLLPPISILLS